MYIYKTYTLRFRCITCRSIITEKKNQDISGRRKKKKILKLKKSLFLTFTNCSTGIQQEAVFS